jgi:hypothetical protein
MRSGLSPFLLASALVLLGGSISCAAKVKSNCGPCPLLSIPATVAIEAVAASPDANMGELEVWLARMRVWCGGLDAERD